MALLELIPWAVSFVMLGAMFYLATIAFRAGEQAGHHDPLSPRHAAEQADAESEGAA
jgi:hypothetical protein